MTSIRLAVIASPLSRTGGVATYWRRLIPHLSEYTESVEMITGHREFDGVDRPTIKLNLRAARWAWKTLTTELASTGVTHVATSISQSDIVFGLLMNRRLKLPWIVFLHGSPYPVKGQTIAPKRWAWRFLWRLAASRANHIVAVSDAAAQYAPAGKNVVVANPIAPSPKSLGEIAGAIGYVGRMSHEKDPALFGRISVATGDRRVFKAFGEGRLLASLRESFPNVDWRGAVPAEKAFSELSLLLLTSRSEGLGLVLIEAAVYGVPTIAVDVGGVSSAIHPKNRAHLLVPARERNDISQWIRRIDALDDVELRSLVVERQREWVSANFSADRALEVIREVLETK